LWNGGTHPLVPLFVEWGTHPLPPLFEGKRRGETRGLVACILSLKNGGTHPLPPLFEGKRGGRRGVWLPASSP